MNTLRRIVYQLRRWWFLRFVRECKRCDGTGDLVVGHYDLRYPCDPIVTICDTCDGYGWLPK